MKVSSQNQLLYQKLQVHFSSIYMHFMAVGGDKVVFKCILCFVGVIFHYWNKRN